MNKRPCLESQLDGSKSCKSLTIALKYIKGKSNIVADALYRKEKEVHMIPSNVVRQLMHLTTIKVSEKILSQLKYDYESDPFLKEHFKDPKEPYSKMGNRTYFEKRLCIPRWSLREMVLHDNHESLIGGHRAFQKTLRLLKRHYHLPTVKSDAKRYIRSCHKFQEAKSDRQSKIGYHQPFPPPTRKWEVISMEFMFDLPKSNGLTGIMVIVDKLSKRTHFIPVNSTGNAKDIAEIFYREIFKHHGLPWKIISDRDTRFTGTFWKELVMLLNVKLNLSTAFHPETDGQSERAFRTLQEMLRCYISYTQKDWYQYLPGLEFAYNNHVNDTPQQSPFFVEYGQNPFSIADTLLSDDSSEKADINDAAQRFFDDIQSATKIAQSSIESSNVTNSDIVNEHRTLVVHAIGEKVMIPKQNPTLKKGHVKKFYPKYIGTFKILEKHANGAAFRLAFPSISAQHHPLFHVSLLKKYTEDKIERYSPTPSSYETSNSESEIDKILNHRINKGSLQYFVHFKGYEDI